MSLRENKIAYRKTKPSNLRYWTQQVTLPDLTYHIWLGFFIPRNENVPFIYKSNICTHIGHKTLQFLSLLYVLEITAPLSESIPHQSILKMLKYDAITVAIYLGTLSHSYTTHTQLSLLPWHHTNFAEDITMIKR
jgi:hypothetical protein